MADAPTMRALTELLAGQVRAEQHHEDLLKRLDESDRIQSQVLQGITGLAIAFRTVREAVDKLTEAANGEKPSKGKDLGIALSSILAELKKQGTALNRAVTGIEALPRLLAQAGVGGEDLHTPNGSAAPVKADKPGGEDVE